MSPRPISRPPKVGCDRPRPTEPPNSGVGPAWGLECSTYLRGASALIASHGILTVPRQLEYGDVTGPGGRPLTRGLRVRPHPSDRTRRNRGKRPRGPYTHKGHLNVIMILPCVMAHRGQDKAATACLVRARRTRWGSGLDLTALSSREGAQQVGEKTG